jgi:hypothetical protein
LSFLFISLTGDDHFGEPKKQICFDILKRKKFILFLFLLSFQDDDDVDVVDVVVVVVVVANGICTTCLRPNSFKMTKESKNSFNTTLL